jgi:hypothetical protein
MAFEILKFGLWSYKYPYVSYSSFSSKIKLDMGIETEIQKFHFLYTLQHG